MAQLAENLRYLLNSWIIPTQKEIQEPIVLESRLGFVTDHPLGSGGLGPLQLGDNVASITSPILLQTENQGTIALESHLGFVYDHPLGSGGLDPLQPGDNVVSFTSPKLSQRENQGSIALESCMGIVSDHAPSWLRGAGSSPTW